MSRKALFPGLLAVASLALTTGCERALPPDPPANLEKAQEIRAGLLGEEEASEEDADKEASLRRPYVESLADSVREATFNSTSPRPRLQS